MPQVMSCPHCRKPVQVPDNAAGKQLRCPTCQQVFAVAGAPAREPVAAGAAVSGRGAAPSPPPAPPRPVPAAPAPASKAAPAPTPTECPNCKATLLPGAIACMDCGYLLQGDGAGAEQEGQPNLCTNPACGVANPPGERTCQRCSTPLPTPAGTMLHNRYRIDKLLAIGGFGAVYLAVDTKMANRPVAIKDMS